MAEASEEPLPSKTLFLRVSIHCEGCKKKVKKVLQSVEGVYNVDIDSYQHKVAVKCNVDHDTLIRRLHKSGKQASVWPEEKKPANQIPAPSNDKKEKNKESSQKSNDKEQKENSDKSNEKQPEPAKDKSIEKENNKEKAKNEDEPKSKPPQETVENLEKEKEKPKENEKEKHKEPSKQEEAENSNGKKKKEKKEEKQNENENEKNHKNRADKVEKEIHPLQPEPEYMHPYTYPYPYAPQPIMSYNMAQPTSSRAYYQQPPTQESYNMYPNPYPYPYSYQNQYQGPYGPPPEYSYGSTIESSARDDSLNYFNEDNANSCSVM